jgi:hypothetical protein
VITSKKNGWVSQQTPGFQKGYGQWSSVDVENVDLEKFPGFKDMKWLDLWMDEGDCLFNPGRWYHHVHGPPDNRSQSILWWWYRQKKFDKASCERPSVASFSATGADCSWGFEEPGVSPPTFCTSSKDKGEL